MRAIHIDSFMRSRFNPITRHDFMKEVLDRMYDFGEIPNLDRLHPHRLAIFFGVMAIGASRSFEIAAAAQAERYYVLACATLSLAPIIAEAMCATIQALYVINSFLFIMARASSEESWLIVGLCGRLAYRVRFSVSASFFVLISYFRSAFVR